MQPTTTMTNTTNSIQQPVYRHTARPDWGRAILAWERGGKRGYQFEDGKLRVFQRGYFHLLEPAGEAEDVSSLARGLQRRADDEMGAGGARNGVARPAVRDLGEQLEVFLAAFPDGFRGDAWSEKHRGTGRKRLKRHRDAAIDHARRGLARDALRAHLAAGRHDAILASAVEILRATDLVSRKQLDGLARVTPDQAGPLARTLVELLHGEGPFDLRLERWLRALLTANVQPGWALVTALPALHDPEHHVCVRPSVFRRQAAAMEASGRWSNTPSAGRYARLRAMAARLAEQLREAGQEPRDLLDVHDFVYMTRRPAASRALDPVRESPRDEQERAAA